MLKVVAANCVCCLFVGNIVERDLIETRKMITVETFSRLGFRRHRRRRLDFFL